MYVCAVQAQAIGVRTGSYWPGCSSTPGEGWSSYVLVHIPPFSGVSLNRSDRFGFPRKFSIPIAQPLVTRCGHSIEYRCSVVCVEEAIVARSLYPGNVSMKFTIRRVVVPAHWAVVDNYFIVHYGFFCSSLKPMDCEYEVYLFVGEAVNEVCGYIAWVEF